MASARNRVPLKSIRPIILAAAAIGVGQVCAPVSAQNPFRATNPSSSLTLTAGTMPCAAGQLIANSSSGPSVTNPFFVLPPRRCRHRAAAALDQRRDTDRMGRPEHPGRPLVGLADLDERRPWRLGAPRPEQVRTSRASFAPCRPNMATAPMPSARPASGRWAGCLRRRRSIGACKPSPAPARPTPGGHSR